MKLTTKKYDKGSARDLSISDSFGQLAEALINPGADTPLSAILSDDSIFEEEPVSIEEFLYGERYLNLSITLSTPQLEFVDKCSTIFEEPIYTEGVLQSGQGSGKDTCSVFLCLRLVYLLLCLRSPQKYLDMGDYSFIDIINVAPTADLAKNIFFDTLTSYMDASVYFAELSLEKTRRLVTFPKQIRLHSSNSVDESWQGLTPILIVLDEIDAFKSEVELRRSKSLRFEGAEGVYKTAKTLVQSRFPDKGKVLCLSWPRFRGSFIQKRFKAGQTEARTYVPRTEAGKPYATWEFNPARKQESFRDFYKNDPVLAKARFECDPPFARDAFIKDTSYILEAFDANMDDLGIITWARNRNVDIGGFRTERQLEMKVRYYIHIDLGLKQSNAALCIAHYTKENEAFIDLIKVWTPRPGEDINLKGIEDFVINLKFQGYWITECTYDGYQSASAIQNLNKAGIDAAYKSVTRGREAYDTLKDLLQQERLIGYYDEATIEELLSLDVVLDKVEARPGALKDRADAIAGAVQGAVKGSAIRREVRDVGELGSMFSSPIKVDDSGMSVPEFVERNTQRTPSRLAGAKVDPWGMTLGPVQCEECNRSTGIEFSDPFGRTNDELGAVLKWCVICGARWKKQDTTDDKWECTQKAMQEKLIMVRGA